MKTAFSTILILVHFFTFAQAKLNIVYQKIYPAPTENDSISNSLPLYYTLNLNQEASEYFIHSNPTKSNEQEEKFEEYIYKNLKKHILIKDFSNPHKRDLPQLPWEIQKQFSKKILGYQTHKAIIREDDKIIIEAWYTPNLPYKNGPYLYHGLPGLILEVTQNPATEESVTLKVVSLDISKNKKEIYEPYVHQ